MCSVLVRIDLDRYELDVVERLIVDGIVSVSEAMSMKKVEEMSDWERVCWVRKIQKRRAA